MGELDFVAEKSARGSLHLFIGNLIADVFNAITIVRALKKHAGV